MITEKKLFDIWVKASIEDAKPENERDKSIINDFWEMFYEILSKGYYYDPNKRYFSEFLEGIDLIPEKLWFLYRPLSDYPVQEMSDLFKLKSINNKLLYKYELFKFEEPIDEFVKKYTLKRYYNSFIKKIAIVSHNEPILKINSLKTKSIDVSYYRIEDSKINKVLYETLQKDYDIIIISTESRQEILLDDFIPAYPTFLHNDVLIMTPILLQQTNGCDENDIIKSFKNRSIQQFGVVLVNSELTKDENFNIKIVEESIKEGISNHQKEILLEDGRIQKLNPKFSKHISFNGHGWISQYSQSNLISALKTVKPKVVLELGIWYGLSTRLISHHNPTKDCKIYCVDFYKNNSIIDKKYTHLTPTDKFYKNHQKYETFYANLSGRIPEKDLTQRFNFDKLDTNETKEIFMMKMNAYEAIDIMKEKNIVPDLIYIDFEKNTKILIKFLVKLHNYFPEAVLIGDDYVYDSVKKAIEEINLKYTWKFIESYAILPDKNLYSIFVKKVKFYYDSIKQVDKVNRKNALENPWKKLVSPNQDGVMIIQYLRKIVDYANIHEKIDILENIDYKVNFTNMVNETPFDIVKFKISRSFL